VGQGEETKQFVRMPENQTTYRASMANRTHLSDPSDKIEKLLAELDFTLYKSPVVLYVPPALAY
jgi:hypothetical protein